MASALEGQQPSPARDRSRIEEAEIRSAAVDNLYDLVESLRPEWLARSARPALREPLFLIFLNQSILGTLNAARELSLNGIRGVRFLTPEETARLGSYSANGAIQALTVLPGSSAAPLNSWADRDTDDHLTVSFAGGWARTSAVDHLADDAAAGAGLFAAVAIPLRPDIFLRMTYFRHAIPAPATATGSSGAGAATLNGVGLEWKGQLSESELFVPYALGGLVIERLAVNGANDTRTREGFGFVIGLGLEARIVPGIFAFVEASHSSAQSVDEGWHFRSAGACGTELCRGAKATLSRVADVVNTLLAQKRVCG